MNINEVKIFEIDHSSSEVRAITFDFYPEESSLQTLNLTLTMATNIESTITFQLILDANAIEPHIGVISAAIILIFLNVLIGAEVCLNVVFIKFFEKSAIFSEYYSPHSNSNFNKKKTNNK